MTGYTFSIDSLSPYKSIQPLWLSDPLNPTNCADEGSTLSMFPCNQSCLVGKEALRTAVPTHQAIELNPPVLTHVQYTHKWRGSYRDTRYLMGSLWWGRRSVWGCLTNGHVVTAYMSAHFTTTQTRRLENTHTHTHTQCGPLPYILRESERNGWSTWSKGSQTCQIKTIVGIYQHFLGE